MRSGDKLEVTVKCREEAYRKVNTGRFCVGSQGIQAKMFGHSQELTPFQASMKMTVAKREKKNLNCTTVSKQAEQDFSGFLHILKQARGCKRSHTLYF